MLKEKILKELYWLAAIALVALVYREFLLPMMGNSALDINQHDTYYIYGSPNTLWIIIPGTCFIVYLTRAILCRFKNTLISGILILFTLFIISWLDNWALTYSLFKHLVEMGNTPVTEPAQDVAPVTGLFYGGDTRFIAYGFYTTTALRTILVLFIAFVGFTIGRNSKRLTVNNS